LLALLSAAIIVWLLARRDGNFSVIGLEGHVSSTLGSLLPAICAGLTLAIALVIVDVVGGPVVAVLTAIALLLLPDFLPLHRTSLFGPPLLTLSVIMLAVMLAAPRFSLAYGTVAAVAVVWVSPAGLGMVVAAVGWALWQPPNGRGRAPRAWLALLPSALAVVIGRAKGSIWPTPLELGWRGGLDQVLAAIGRELSAQLVPAIENGALRWFMVADTTLVLLALVVLGWQQSAAAASPARPRRFFPAAAILTGSLVVGLVTRSMLVRGAPLPDVETVLPLAVLLTLVVAVSASLLWPRWRWWGKGIAVLLLLGWMGAAAAG
jgi:hypothetical protein